MVRIEPVRALRPSGDVAARTVDGALRSGDRIARRHQHPRQVSWLEAWGDHEPEPIEPWIDDGSLLEDDEPSLRIVEQTPPGAEAVVGVLGLVPPADMVPHEQTDDLAVARRAARDAVQQVEIRPLLGVLASEPPGLADVVARVRACAPEADVVDDQGTRHRVWRCEARDGAALVALTAPVPCLLADGHHRVAAAIRRSRPDALTLVTFSSAAPRLLPVWRVAAVPRGQDDEVAAWIAELPVGDDIEVLARDRRRTTAGRDGELGVETSHRLATEVPFVSRVTTAASEAVVSVARRDGAVVVGAPAPTVEEVLAAVAAGRSLPPKSTAFWPKPRVGLALRRL